MPVKLQAPDGATSCTHDGEIYEVEKGFVTVPNNAVAALASHGYSVAPNPTQDTAEHDGVADMTRVQLIEELTTAERPPASAAKKDELVEAVRALRADQKAAADAAAAGDGETKPTE